MHETATGLLSLILLVASLGVAGCTQNAATLDGARNGVAWPYWPTQLRVHPLTRIVEDPAAGQTLLEARVELLDREGHTTKGVGLLVMEIRGPGGGPIQERWERDLTDAATNRLHYDEVTRTYLLRLAIDRTLLPERPFLDAILIVPGRDALEDSLRLVVD